MGRFNAKIVSYSVKNSSRAFSAFEREVMWITVNVGTDIREAGEGRCFCQHPHSNVNDVYAQ